MKKEKKASPRIYRKRIEDIARGLSPVRSNRNNKRFVLRKEEREIFTGRLFSLIPYIILRLSQTLHCPGLSKTTPVLPQLQAEKPGQ